MSYFIQYKNDDGFISNLYPNLEYSLSYIIESTLKNKEYRIIENPNIEDKKFKRSYVVDWNLPNGSISPYTLDLNIAKTIFIEFLRNNRTPILSNLDIQFMRALEQGNTTLSAEIAAKKQELRDITQMDLSSATDLTSLKQLWPTSILGDSPF